MAETSASVHQLYLDWVEEQIEEFKASVSREELLDLAEEAVEELHDAPDGQYALTEILLCDTVDTLIFQRLGLPSYRNWLRKLKENDRPPASDSDAS